MGRRGGARSGLLAWLERLSFFGLLTLIALAPLPLASNRLWSSSLLGSLSALLLWGAVLIELARRRQSPATGSALLSAALLYGAVLVVVIIQGSCLPAVIGVTGPIGDGEPVADCAALSFDPVATWTALARLMTYGSVFWIAVVLATNGNRAGQLYRFMAVTVVAYSLYGLLTHFAGIRPALFFEEWPYAGFVTSTFVNRNSFAVYAGMGAVLCLGPIVDGMFGLRTHGRRLPWRQMAEAAALRAPWALGFVICFVGVVLSASRAGSAAMVAGLIMLATAIGIHRQQRWRTALLGGLMVTVLALIAVQSGGGTLVGRLDRAGDDWQVRGTVIVTTLAAAMERPWLGVGYGAFETAWPGIRPVGLPLRFSQAHSTFVENWYELGFPAGTALMVAVGILMLRCGRGLVERKRNGLFPGAALAATIVPVLHSTVDFSLQIPAVTLTMMVLLGLGFAQSFPTRASPEASGEQSLLPTGVEALGNGR